MSQEQPLTVEDKPKRERKRPVRPAVMNVYRGCIKSLPKYTEDDKKRSCFREPNYKPAISGLGQTNIPGGRGWSSCFPVELCGLCYLYDLQNPYTVCKIVEYLEKFFADMDKKNGCAIMYFVANDGHKDTIEFMEEYFGFTRMTPRVHNIKHLRNHPAMWGIIWTWDWDDITRFNTTSAQVRRDHELHTTRRNAQPIG